MLPAMISIALLGIAVAIVAEGGLAILGVSVEPPTADVGHDHQRRPQLAAAMRRSSCSSPSIAIFLTVLSLNYLGDVIRDRFDVRESAL